MTDNFNPADHKLTESQKADLKNRDYLYDKIYYFTRINSLQEKAINKLMSARNMKEYIEAKEYAMEVMKLVEGNKRPE